MYARPVQLYKYEVKIEFPGGTISEALVAACSPDAVENEALDAEYPSAGTGETARQLGGKVVSVHIAHTLSFAVFLGWEHACLQDDLCKKFPV